MASRSSHGVSMRRGAWMKSWWGRAGLIGAAFLVLLGSGTVLFDRNGDGVDDGGLDMRAPMQQRALLLLPLLALQWCRSN